MKKLLLLIPLLCACTHAVRLTDTADYTETYYSPSHADGFSIRSLAGDSTALLLEIYRPDTMSIAIPPGGFHSIVCLSSTYVGTLREAGLADRIVGVSNRDYLADSEVKRRAADIGYEGAMDYERLLAIKPDIALIYGIGGKNPAEEKLKELSIPYVYLNDFEEQNPLGRAEWAVAVGALAGTDLRSRFDSIAAAYVAADGEATKVMVNAPYNGAWFIPGRDNYMTRLLRDAGAALTAPQPEGTESKPIDVEVAVGALESADLWLFPGQASTLDGARLLAPKARVGAKPVWKQTPEFYETGASRPDLVLGELKTVISGEAPDSLRYFRRLR